jgi:hypothetical protein
VWDEVGFLLNVLCWNLFVLALTLVAALLPDRTRAQANLVWQRKPGAEACPDENQLRELVLARVGSDTLWGSHVPGPASALDQAGAQRTLEGEVVPLSPGHRVQLRLREQSGQLLGERTLTDASADCTALTEATALAVALLFESAPPVRTTPPSPPAPVPPVVAPVPAAPEAPSRYAATAGALGSLALLPVPRVHAFVGLRVAPRRTYALELRLVALGGARVRALGGSLGDARFSTTHAQLGGCRTLVSAPWLGLAACAGLVAGVVSANGSGFSERDYRRRAMLLAGSARVVTELTLVGPLAASLAVGLGVPFVHTRFVAVDTTGQPRELARTRPLFGTAELGLTLRL